VGQGQVERWEGMNVGREEKIETNKQNKQRSTKKTEKERKKREEKRLKGERDLISPSILFSFSNSLGHSEKRER
jgi:hypothetical protein